MAQVTIAEHAGACFGVERALKLVRDLAATTQGVRTLGPLIHNPRVIAELEQRGVSPLKSADECQFGDTLVLRTHGVSPQVELEAQAHASSVVDATCPFVKRVHRLASKLSNEGYQVIVLGQKGHAEVEGIVGYAPDALVVLSASELNDIPLAQRVAVVVQTTQVQSALCDLASALSARCDELRIYNTICDATAERQRAAIALASKVDVMVVVGGKNSANTTHLFDLCAERCDRSYHIEDARELQASWFEGAEQVGLTGGASTPREHIAEVADAIQGLMR